MMSFCKKSLHSFLGLTLPMNLDHHPCPNNTTRPSEKPSSKCPAGGGELGLITAADDYSCKTPNVFESATVKTTSLPPSPSPSPSPSPPFVKKDPCGIGFIDDVGGGVNGLMSCTESLGFESCDERRADDEIMMMDEYNNESKTRLSPQPRKWRNVGERREVKKFPPPLSSFNHNGQPTFFLRPVRKDGRLELMEVRIDRPEILRAHREDGRLRLHLVTDNQGFDDVNDEEPHQDQELDEEREQEQKDDEEEEEKEDDGGEIEEEEEEEERGEEWRFPVSGEGFRRCHELVTPHHHYHLHHQNLHVWSQHCVTTR